jgi:hypothetical protein
MKRTRHPSNDWRIVVLKEFWVAEVVLVREGIATVAVAVAVLMREMCARFAGRFAGTNIGRWVKRGAGGESKVI